MYDCNQKPWEFLPPQEKEYRYLLFSDKGQERKTDASYCTNPRIWPIFLGMLKQILGRIHCRHISSAAKG